jgi:iron complex outermembrane receptor protein
MKNHKKGLFFAVFMILWASFGFAQDATEDEAIQLPPAKLSAEAESSQFITQEEMERRGDSDLYEAMRWVPGVFQQDGGTRNEGAFSLRGFGAKAVPVYLDGVLWGDPYGGQVDYSRFLTGDLESIEINKGYSSILLGPNNLGGAVIMRMAKPKKPLELSLKTAWDFDKEGYAGNLETFSAGTKMNLYYGRVAFQWRDVDHFSLPDSFKPFGGVAGAGGNPQGSGKRLWSDSRDLKASALAGFTPFETLDVWATYAFSQSEKGFSPPDASSMDKTSKPTYRVWDWPYVRRHTATLNGEFKPENFYVNVKGYFDKYDNRLDTYPAFGGPNVSGDGAWAAYLSGTHAPHSDYSDYIAGGNLEGGLKINSWNKIAGTVQFKQTSHTQFDGDIKTADETENILFAGAEYSISPIEPFTIRVGAAANVYIPGTMQTWDSTSGKENPTINDPETQVMPNVQTGLFYAFSKDHELRLTWALKSRYATLKEKFSSLGTGNNLPNPDLKAESAHHFELGYKGYFLEKINFNAAAFCSYALDTITNVTIDADTKKTQYQNIDETIFYGFEAGSEMFFNKYLTAGTAFGLTKYDIKHSANDIDYITDLPEFTANAYMVIRPLAMIKAVENLSVIPSFEYVGSKDIASSGSRAIRPSHSLVHLKVAADITKYASLSFSVNNLFDELYENTTGFPEAGRSFNVTLTGKY